MMVKRPPLALWVFGPVGSGKSRVLAGLPLSDFKIIDQDAVLERELRARGWHARINEYDPAQQAELARLRQEIAANLWGQAPGWRAAGENLAFETTGDKPHLFRIEIEAGRRHGYETLICALRCPLARCLAQNAGRARVLPAEVVEATWQAFERALREGVYREMFAEERFHVCDDAGQATDIAAEWLRERGVKSAL